MYLIFFQFIYYNNYFIFLFMINIIYYCFSFFESIKEKLYNYCFVGHNILANNIYLKKQLILEMVYRMQFIMGIIFIM